MRFTVVSLVSLAMICQPVLASWRLDFYKSGCPDPDDAGSGDITGGTAGEPGQELWCISTGSAHNVDVVGIEADNMIATLFSDWQCTAKIADVETDGCHVIPSTTVIEAVRILPK
ncbi:hypothetical protein G7046_g413 [Stylonectria norvegica]|nr:hypothetical protein G7046_g413 [Stylonectria norvegica]